MRYQDAFLSAKSYIESKQIMDIANLKDIRNKLTANPSIKLLFSAVKDALCNNECEQVLFLNPLPYLFSEQFSRGIYTCSYTKLELLGSIPDNRHLNLRCGRPGIVLLGKDWVHEILFSDYNLPNLFSDELVLLSFCIELDMIIHAHSSVALKARRDSDYGITDYSLSVLPFEHKQFDLKSYFGYSIIDLDLNFRKSLIEECETFYNWRELFRNGTIGVVSQRKYSVSGNVSTGKWIRRYSGYSYPSIQRQENLSMVGILLKLRNDKPIQEEVPLKWF